MSELPDGWPSQPPITDYAMLSDCHAPALVSRDGSVDWWCPPRADGPSVFGRLLDADAGHWTLSAVDPAEISRRYLDDTLVLETTVITESGEVQILDCLALEPGARGHDIGFKVPQLLVRSVEGVRGSVTVRCEFAPRVEYGLTVPHLEESDGVIVAEGGPVRLRLSTPVPLRIDEGTATGELTVEEGKQHTFALAYASLHGKDEAAGTEPGEALTETLAGWRSWVDAHDPYEGPHAEAVQRSALVLQALTYQPSGAVLAAPTTSLPAELGGSDNWDYRYAWLRDLSLTTQALWIGACPDEVGRFLQFIADAAGQPAEGDRVQIMYGLDGRRWLPEHELDHLAGYADSRPVRIGNDAWDQSQLDVMGEVLDLALRYRDQLDPINERTRRLLRWMAEEAATTWQAEDAGMWESRDGGRHYTTSKVMCWVALDRALQLADLLDAQDEIDRWQAIAEEIRQTVLEQAWNADIDAYAGALGSDRLDASVLLMPLVGFLDARDERMRATIRAIQRELTRDGLVYRWDGDANGFVLCTAWLVECLALAGEHDEAAGLLDRLVARANDLGLYAEQIEPATGAHAGNYPQAFSHVGIINAAWRIGQTADQQTPSSPT
ncbi:MAG TPA: glycoside hydrolase family 15 protein [Egibacteraceae bacterium]|jgi:GH15 family glucan-1,4-alpha-glucosidase|nr:glycoside hydrolase family 15 protein [Egibacteraceae bacterium]